MFIVYRLLNGTRSISFFVFFLKFDYCFAMDIISFF